MLVDFKPWWVDLSICSFAYSLPANFNSSYTYIFYGITYFYIRRYEIISLHDCPENKYLWYKHIQTSIYIYIYKTIIDARLKNKISNYVFLLFNIWIFFEKLILRENMLPNVGANLLHPIEEQPILSLLHVCTYLSLTSTSHACLIFDILRCKGNFYVNIYLDMICKTIKCHCLQILLYKQKI